MTWLERRAALLRNPASAAWLDRAHAARVEQGLPEFIEDDETIDFIAAALLGATPRRDGAPPEEERRSDPTPITGDDHRERTPER